MATLMISLDIIPVPFTDPQATALSRRESVEDYDPRFPDPGSLPQANAYRWLFQQEALQHFQEVAQREEVRDASFSLIRYDLPWQGSTHCVTLHTALSLRYKSVRIVGPIFTSIFAEFLRQHHMTSDETQSLLHYYLDAYFQSLDAQITVIALPLREGHALKGEAHRFFTACRWIVADTYTQGKFNVIAGRVIYWFSHEGVEPICAQRLMHDYTLHTQLHALENTWYGCVQRGRKKLRRTEEEKELVRNQVDFMCAWIAQAWRDHNESH
jgi:hypothetical protein